MPTRRKPYSTATRYKALKAGKEHKDMIPTPSTIPYKSSTIASLDAFFPAYKAKIEAVEALLLQQTTLSAQMKTVRPKAELFVNHFYQALQNAIRRETFIPEVRTVYGLDANDGNIPVMNSEESISYWGDKAIAGENARVLAGGAPITFPGLPEVIAHLTAFNNLNFQQSEAKTAYDNGQESIAADAIIADELILRMWNETEAEFDKGDKPSMRRKAREWGVVYVPTPGEAPSPEDFSIMGTVTAQATGLPLEDVAIKVVEIDEAYLTDADGEYFIPVLTAGNYTLEITKPGYEVETLPVTVTAGAITELDIELAPVGVLTGSVAGVVRQAAIPQGGVTVSIDGFPLLTTITNAAGSYNLDNIPAGVQTIRAQMPPAMGGAVLTHSITVVAGSEVVRNFDF